MSKKITGGCLCGQVRYELSGPFGQFHWCHCKRCRKSTGSAHAANIFFKPKQLNWLSGENLIKRYELPQAKRFSKSFCSHCGSLLPCVSRDGATMCLPAGSLDDDPQIRPDDNIFWAERSAWYDDGLVAEKFSAYPE